MNEDFYDEYKATPWDSKPRYVLLEGLREHNRFFSLNIGGDPRISNHGELWYRIIGYAETIPEAQAKLYGKAFQ